MYGTEASLRFGTLISKYTLLIHSASLRIYAALSVIAVLLHDPPLVITIFFLQYFVSQATLITLIPKIQTEYLFK